MVLGLLSAVAAVPAIVGTTEAIRYGQRQQAREAHRGRKSHLIVNLSHKDEWSQRFDGSKIVLANRKLYVDLAAVQLEKRYRAHPFSGYYLPHPQNQSRWKAEGWRGEGMVTTVSDDPPMLNWVYVDRDTFEVRYGTRAEAQGHLLGPWDATEGDRRVTFNGWEGFIAVREDADAELWALYFDVKRDGLASAAQGRRPDGAMMLWVELHRREKKKGWQAAEEERSERQQRYEEKEREEQERMEKEMEERDRRQEEERYEETVE